MAMLPGAQKDSQLVTPQWEMLREPIEGVHMHEVRHVPRDHGISAAAASGKIRWRNREDNFSGGAAKSITPTPTRPHRGGGGI